MGDRNRDGRVKVFFGEEKKMSDSEEEDYYQPQTSRADRELNRYVGDVAIKDTDNFRVRKGKDLRKHLTEKPKDPQLLAEREARDASDKQIIENLKTSDRDDRFTLWRDMLVRKKFNVTTDTSSRKWRR